MAYSLISYATGQLYLFVRTGLDMKEKEADQIRTTKHETPHHTFIHPQGTSFLQNILLRALFSDILRFEKLLLTSTAMFLQHDAILFCSTNY
jgi:hypothetical protein